MKWETITEPLFSLFFINYEERSIYRSFTQNYSAAGLNYQWYLIIARCLLFPQRYALLKLCYFGILIMVQNYSLWIVLNCLNMNSNMYRYSRYRIWLAKADIMVYFNSFLFVLQLISLSGKNEIFLKIKMSKLIVLKKVFH